MRELKCPCCEIAPYKTEKDETMEYRCSNPTPKCGWSEQHYKLHNEEQNYYRFRLGKTQEQVKRVYEEFEGKITELRQDDSEIEYIKQW